MEDQTTPPFIVKTESTVTPSKVIPINNGESQIKGLSVRALVALIVVLTVCCMSFIGKTVSEPLYTLATITVGFYFGQNHTSKTPINENKTTT